MNICTITPIVLEPYSTEMLIVVSGHSSEEVKEWFKECHVGTKFKNLKDIKKHYEWVNEHLDTFDKLQKDFEKLDQHGVGGSNGIYAYYELKSYPGTKARIVILKYGFDPANWKHMTTLAHEMLHVCQEFLPQFLNRDEEAEAEAYFHSYLMEKAYTPFITE